MTKEKEYLINQIIQTVERIDGVKKIKLRHPLTGNTEFLEIDASEEEINDAKEKIADSILKYYDVKPVKGVEDEFTIELKEGFK